VQGSLSQIIRDVFERHTEQEARFYDIDKELRRLKSAAKKVDQLDMQVD